MYRNCAKAIGDLLKTISDLKVCDTARSPKDAEEAAQILGAENSDQVRGCFVQPSEIIEIEKDELEEITAYGIKFEIQYWRSLVDAIQYEGSSEQGFVSDLNAIRDVFIKRQGANVYDTDGVTILRKVEIGSMSSIEFINSMNVHYFRFELIGYDRP